MSEDPEGPVIELDNCTQWINDHNQSFSETGIPPHLEIEWAELCIGHQRWVRWLGSSLNY